MSKPWNEVRCMECDKVIAETQSSQPLPSLFCPECAEKEKQDE